MNHIDVSNFSIKGKKMLPLTASFFILLELEVLQVLDFFSNQT